MLCCPLESVNTMHCRTHAEQKVHAGEIIMMNDTIGVVLEDAGPNAIFILIYQAEKIYAPKMKDRPLLAGQTAYYDHLRKEIVPFTVDGLNEITPCGKVLADANPGDEVVLIHLMVMK